ncbi:hypothetical protein [Sutcliffiella halmapala]|uniref:hypothetical protein n=1 Tax=Sutcliffiella halmapala TaxID=79882 RepID=UPI0009949166|nr:hypothetical protein [Sutcliffiella halmapala]
MKKIRGWKRRVRQLEAFKKEHVAFDRDFLKDNKVEYQKLFNYPEIDNIPLWYKADIVTTFIDTFHAWKEQADAQLSSYYLRLHINTVDIFDSELILSIDEQIEAYKNRFLKCEDHLKLPSWLNNNNSIEWKCYYMHSTWLKDEIDTLPEEEKQTLMDNLVETRKIDTLDGERVEEYLINEGIVFYLDYEKIEQ